MMKVLISSPRTGSSWVYDGIRSHNQSLPGELVSLDPAEFFHPDHPFICGPIEDKIVWLEQHRAAGVEVSFKHHINYLITDRCDFYREWFIHFYRNHEVVVLRRRDTWAWFKSFLVQDMMNWRTAGLTVSSIPDLSENTKYDEHQSADDSLRQFTRIKQQLDAVSGDTEIWYEDQIGDWSSDLLRLSGHFDYDGFLSNHVDMNEMRRKFDQCMNQ